MSCPGDAAYKAILVRSHGDAVLSLEVNGCQQDEPDCPIRINLAYGSRKNPFVFFWLPSNWQDSAEETLNVALRHKYAKQMYRLFDCKDYKIQIRKEETGPIYWAKRDNRIVEFPLVIDANTSGREMEDTKLCVYSIEAPYAPRLCIHYGSDGENFIQTKQEERLSDLLDRVGKKCKSDLKNYSLEPGMSLQLLAKGCTGLGNKKLSSLQELAAVNKDSYCIPLVIGEFYPTKPQLLSNKNGFPQIYIPKYLEGEHILSCVDLSNGPVRVFSINQMQEKNKMMQNAPMSLDFLELPPGWYKMRVSEDEILESDDDDEYEDYGDELYEDELYEDEERDDKYLETHETYNFSWRSYGLASSSNIGVFPSSLPDSFKNYEMCREFYAFLPAKIRNALYDEWAKPQLDNEKVTLSCPLLKKHYFLRLYSLWELLCPWPFPESPEQGEKDKYFFNEEIGESEENGRDKIELFFEKVLRGKPKGLYVARLYHCIDTWYEADSNVCDELVDEVCFCYGNDESVRKNLIDAFEQEYIYKELLEIISLLDESDAERYCRALKYPLMKETINDIVNKLGLLNKTNVKTPKRLADGTLSLWRWLVRMDDKDVMLPPMAAISPLNEGARLYMLSNSEAKEVKFTEIDNNPELFGFGKNGYFIRSTEEYVSHPIVMTKDGKECFRISCPGSFKVTATSWTECSKFENNFETKVKKYSSKEYADVYGISLPHLTENYTSLCLEQLRDSLIPVALSFRKLIIHEGKQQLGNPTWGEVPSVKDEQFLICRRLLQFPGQYGRGDILCDWYFENNPVPSYPNALLSIDERIRSSLNRREQNRIFIEKFMEILNEESLSPKQQKAVLGKSPDELCIIGEKFFKEFRKFGRIDTFNKKKLEEKYNKALPELTSLLRDNKVTTKQMDLIGIDGKIVGWLEHNGNPVAATAMLVALCLSERFREQADPISISELVCGFLYSDAKYERAGLKFFINYVNHIFPVKN